MAASRAPTGASPQARNSAATSPSTRGRPEIAAAGATCRGGAVALTRRHVYGLVTVWKSPKSGPLSAPPAPGGRSPPCHVRRPCTASAPVPIPRIVVGFRVQWLLQVLQRGRSASARRVLRNCLWCDILYRVRDPGASRRASLKRELLVRRCLQGRCE